MLRRKVAAVFRPVTGASGVILRTASSSNDKGKMHFGIDSAKFDLKLNLGAIDFNKVVESTKRAKLGESRASELWGKESTYDAALSEMSKRVDESARPTDASPPVAQVKAQEFSTRSNAGGATAAAAATASSSAQHGRGDPISDHRPSRESSSSFRGVVGGAAVHQAGSLKAVNDQRIQEGGRQQTLKDNLSYLANNGNWVKAYSLFEDAVQKACQFIISTTAVPSQESEGTGVDSEPTASSLEEGEVDLERERRAKQEALCFELIRRKYAVLPPAPSNYIRDNQVYAVRSQFLRSGAGIMRWQGQHYYLLLKVLMETSRVKEAERVWAVMRDTGFTEYQMNEKTVNSLMSLVRRSSAGDGGDNDGDSDTEGNVGRLVSSVLAHPSNSASLLSEEHEFQRNVFTELARLAQQKKFLLGASNRKTAQGIRVASALQSTTPSAPNEELGDVSAGDFNGLLREAKTHEETQRILAAMRKLGMEADDFSYAHIVASLHNPAYVVEGATEEEAKQSCSSSPDGGESSGDPETTSAAAAAAAASGGEVTKTMYEAYKDKRVAAALRWFHACPEEQRNATLYNEVLYLLRGKAHTAEYNAVLAEFRGNPLRDEEGMAKAEEIYKRNETLPSGTAPEMVPFILSPQWATRPNDKTYELLVSRCCYLHDWQAMWDLYNELRQQNMRGTKRLYQQLLTHAQAHPPLHIVRDGKDPQQLVLDIYEEMKHKRMDVSSLTSTANLVNAWSASRSKKRHWRHTEHA